MINNRAFSSAWKCNSLVIMPRKQEAVKRNLEKVLQIAILPAGHTLKMELYKTLKSLSSVFQAETPNDLAVCSEKLGDSPLCQWKSEAHRQPDERARSKRTDESHVSLLRSGATSFWLAGYQPGRPPLRRCEAVCFFSTTSKPSCQRNVN